MLSNKERKTLKDFELLYGKTDMGGQDDELFMKQVDDILNSDEDSDTDTEEEDDEDEDEESNSQNAEDSSQSFKAAMHQLNAKKLSQSTENDSPFKTQAKATGSAAAAQDIFR